MRSAAYRPFRSAGRLGLAVSFALAALFGPAGSFFGSSAETADRVSASSAAADLPAPGPNRYVHDFARLLLPEEEARITAVGRSLEAKTGAQLVAVTVESTGGRSIDDYALRLFRAWGIGQKGKNNGVLLLVNRENLFAGRPGKVRIEVGYGLEGVIPDGVAGRILDDVVLPAWAAGDIGRGIVEGYLALAARIARDAGLELADALGEDLRAYEAIGAPPILPGWAVIVAVFAWAALFVGLAVWCQRRAGDPDPRRRCPFAVGRIDDDERPWFWGGFGGLGDSGHSGGSGGSGFGGGSSGGGGASR